MSRMDVNEYLTYSGFRSGWHVLINPDGHLWCHYGIFMRMEDFIVQLENILN